VRGVGRQGRKHGEGVHMRLREFRIRGFRCVHDSGLVSVRDVAALIGRNESGKTALLEGLLLLNKDSKLEQVDLTDGMDATSEESFRVAEGVFELNPEEIAEISAFNPTASPLDRITILRRAACDHPEYDFPRENFPTRYVSSELNCSVFILKRDSLIDQLNSRAAKPGLTAEPERGFLAKGAIPTTPTELQQQVSSIRSLMELVETDDGLSNTAAEFETAAKGLFVPEETAELVENLIREKLHPRFVYFSEYKIINGAVQLPQFLSGEASGFVERLESGERLDKRDTIDNLFYLSKIDPKHLNELKGKLAALNQYLGNGSRRLTEALQATWKGQRIEAEINYDHDIVWVRISDLHRDGTRTNKQLLQRRSTGLRWYFSFLVNFRAETRRANLKEAILLLDEPGLHLHPIQQGGLLDEIKELASQNQVLYTTHSPFMIFSYETGNLMTVETDPETHLSVIRDAYWDGKPETIIPILHSLGAQQLVPVASPDLASRMPPQLVIEGDTDFLYLITANKIITEKILGAEEALPPHRDAALWNIQLAQANGAPAIMPRALILRRAGHDVAVLYDNEPEAHHHAEELEKKEFPKNRILFVVSDGKEESDIEDIFSESEYLKAVNEVYRDKVKLPLYTPISKEALAQIKQTTKLKRIVPLLEQLWQQHVADRWGQFSKKRVCEHLCSKAIDNKGFEPISMNRFGELFKKVNQCFRPDPLPEAVPNAASK
jgi:hypothetical protein